MKKKLCILSIIIIIAGIVMVAVKGFNVGLEYKAHRALVVPMGTEYSKADIKGITNEVFGKQKVIIKNGSIYNDTAVIELENASDEQINTLRDKVIEKYNLRAKAEELKAEQEKAAAENKTENTETTEKKELTNDDILKIENLEIPRVTLLDLSKQYSWYVLVATVIILVYFMFEYRKLNAGMVLFKSVALLAISELLYAAIIALVRYPIDKVIIAAAVAIYISVLTYLNFVFAKEKAEKFSKTEKSK